MVFETASYDYLGHVHQWLNIDDFPYLAVQSAKNVIKFFSVDSKTKRVEENKNLRITLSDSDEISCTAFDKNSENIFLVKNAKSFEQRPVSGDHGVLMTIPLEEGLYGGGAKRNISVSDDGTFCALGGGDDSNYWYLIDIKQRNQSKFTSNTLKHSWSPCFINGENEYVAVGGYGKVEILDIVSGSTLKLIDLGHTNYIVALYSVNNILAVGGYDKMIRLYDVRTWDMIQSKVYKIEISSIHLTPDLKYLTVSGNGGCFVEKLY